MMQNYNPQTGYLPNTGQAPMQVQYPYGYSNVLTKQSYENFQQNQFLKCRPVSSKEEAMAFQIDLDGSLWVFTDVGNDKIYTKQINNDGTASFRTYAYDKNDNFYAGNEYVTREQFNKAIQALMAATQVQSVQPPASAPSKELDF